MWLSHELLTSLDIPKSSWVFPSYQHPPRGGVWTLRGCLMAPLTIHWACQVAGYAKELQALFEIFAAAADMRMLEQAPIFSWKTGGFANVARYLPASSKIEFSQIGFTKPERSPLRKVQELSDVILSISVARFVKANVPGRWWQLKYFWNFHPENWGRWSDFDQYFSIGLVQPPTSHWNHDSMIPSSPRAHESGWLVRMTFLMG